MSEEVERLAAIRIVAIAHHFPHDLLGLAVFAFGDALLGQFHSALAKAFDRGIVLGGRRQGIGQKADRHPKFIMGLGEIIRLQGKLAPGQRALSLQNSRLSPGDLVFGDIPHILRGGEKARRAG